MLEKHFQPEQAEPRIYEMWEKTRAFAAGVSNDSGDGKPYCIVIPPPNVTGSLHMGHALNNTIQDILVRFERMRGRDVLWQPGMDHAGIATQMVVERQMAERNHPGRRDMGRDAFIERVWKWKEESGGTIINQLKRLGASCDWDRERFTMDEGLSVAVRKVFVELHRAGLIYKDKRLVNWDPVFQTAISDLEVEQKEVNGHMWQFAYPLVDGPVDGIEEIVIATTRPETMLGDGAVAVHPSDERYRNLVGKMVRLPVAERHIPIITDEYPDPEFGSGAVKITGAHDFNDFEVARRNNIDLIPLMDGQARMIVTPENNVPDHYAGLDRYDARELILKEIKELGFYRGVEEKIIAQPFGDRSGVVIEPMLTDQWYVDAETLAKPAIEAVEMGKTKFVPANWDKTYFEWMRNIQPWCISRQLWWGHQIPAWYGPDGEIFVADSEEDARAAAKIHYGDDSELTRDPDVLDTWFSSALWPFSTLGWPDETPELERYYPTSVLVTGFDIIFFWVARMMMMGLHFMKEIPFDTVYIHALVRDEQGQKMSKSKGNVIDPLELVDEFGADAVRFTLAAMAAQGRDIRLARSRVEGYRNFTTKLWNAARFAEMNACRFDASFDPSSVKETLNRWIVGEVQRAQHQVTEGIERHRYNEAASALYQFVWHIFCDWHLELAKPIFGGDDAAAKLETRMTTAWALQQALLLLQPFMPFITQDLWQKLNNRKDSDDLLMTQVWPSHNGLENPDADAEIGWIIDTVTQIRSVRAEMNVPAGTKVPFVLAEASPDVAKRANRYETLIRRLARLSEYSVGTSIPTGSAQIVTDDGIIALPLGDVMDLGAERERLQREIENITGEIAKFEAKLSNENFTSKAPAAIVEEQRRRMEDAIISKDKLSEALARFQQMA